MINCDVCVVKRNVLDRDSQELYEPEILLLAILTFGNLEELQVDALVGGGSGGEELAVLLIKYQVWRLYNHLVDMGAFLQLDKVQFAFLKYGDVYVGKLDSKVSKVAIHVVASIEQRVEVLVLVNCRAQL